MLRLIFFKICSNWSSCKDSSIVLQKILPDSFYNSWGWLEGVKISIIDNLGEVIYTCHKSHVEFENSTYMFTFLEYRILEIKFRIIASLKNSNSGNAWHEVFENPIIGCHHNFLRNLTAEFLPSLPPFTNYLMIIIILLIMIIIIIPMWLSWPGKKEMIKTCQLVFSLPFLASLLPQVDHGHRGSPCYCYCIVTVNNSNSVIFIVIVLVIVIVIVIVRATIIVIYVLNLSDDPEMWNT